MWSKARSLVLACLSAPLGAGCQIHGTESGVCTRRYLPLSSALEDIERSRSLWERDVPFCGRFVASYFRPCVPSGPAASWSAADKNFPEGRAVAAGDDGGVEDVGLIREKDAWVERTVNDVVRSRIDQEGRQGSKHYWKNDDCQEAYARYLCWLNFPRCDDSDDASLPMCQSGKRKHPLQRRLLLTKRTLIDKRLVLLPARDATSVCENLFRVCGFSSDLWRCEQDLVEPEDEYGPTASSYFPGQPFARNDRDNPICTPSIKGAGPSRFRRGLLFFVSLASVVVAWI